MKMFQSTFSRISLLLLFILCFSSANAQDMDNGKKIFEANCTACHKLGEILIGPDLTGVKSRWSAEKDLHAFVKNSQAVIGGGNAYAKKLFDKFNVVMPPQNLDEKQIADVIAYADAGGTIKDPKMPPTGDPIGAYSPIPESNNFARYLFYGIVLLLIVIFFMATSLMSRVSKMRAPEVQPKLNYGRVNAYLFPLFLVLWFGMIIYEIGAHNKYMLPESASDTGIEIDRLFNITMLVTGIVFVLVQVLLFYYAFRYRHREGKKAYFYSHNNKIEFIWTSIPAVVLAALVLYGFKTWQKATNNPNNNPVTIEIYAYQFAFEFRYPGPDGKLGKVDFLKIDPASNPFGLDFSDPAAKDDYITTELHMPVNKDVYFKLRSRDVTHAAYLPHFRAQMYVQPGLDNRIRFKPIITTAEMRNKVKNPNFNYELACNQLCGASHFNMRRLVVVETQDEYEKWTKTFKPFYESYQANQKTALNTQNK